MFSRLQITRPTAKQAATGAVPVMKSRALPELRCACSGLRLRPVMGPDLYRESRNQQFQSASLDFSGALS
jgi:hypothetical protein